MRFIPILLTLIAFSNGLLAENWPTFRGPTGQGISTETHLASEWDEKKNILWRTPTPGIGWSSPIVWEDRIFLTATPPDGISCHVLCLSTKDGKILWDKEVFQQTPTRKEGKNSYATPTPVTDGKRVYAFFAGGGAAALDFEGQVIWTNQDHPFYSQHGLGASPRLYKDMLIMPFDWSTLPGEGDKFVGWQKPWDKSFVLALDVNTGKERWKAMRKQSRIGHVTPIITEVDGKPQLVSGAGDVVEGFDPDTGAEIWSAKSGGEGVVPSIVVGDGLAFSSSGFPTYVPGGAAIRAYRLSGAKGDVTQSHLAWEQKKAVPHIPSFLLHDHLLYTITEDGLAQCLDAATGQILWSKRLERAYAASPVYADGKIYFISEDGLTTIIQPGKEFKELSKNPLNDHVQASMAISGGKLLIRTEKALWCIGNP
jgi:outer membrane protein assembly factor BamB